MKKPRKFLPARSFVKVTGTIHWQVTGAGIARICRELEQERRNGQNFEDREEWRNTWDELFHRKKRGQN